ncbi:helix-turn-helix transcriptional regulator [Streptomyces sp. 378]|uniref:helix-turn-helix domain-containing protein n=1 Tax=Streptomyces sp. 378 TaxID=3049412 RepID=UPI0024C461EA|nr:helix-turn-helix transcriptional regulator [Streptomyces sp. 378]MDK1344648.1 helix-turn-helix transcriptional regulator [Streptomyces sp. 378]
MTGRQPESRAEAARKLGDALRDLQRQSGRPLRNLEAQVRISDSSLSRYFRGETVPTWPVVRDVCRALGADPSAYRALWEAAVPGHQETPAAAVGGDTVEADGSPPLPHRAPWRRLRGPWPLRRIVTAVLAAVVAGALVTGLWLLLSPQDGPGATPAQGAAAGASSGGSAGVLVHNVEKACQEPRTHRCALSLAYNPYRPYTTTNSAGRVWHRDLLQARCTIANGVTVTDENHKHTSIWIQVTHNGQRLWLPGIRVRPGHLTQLTTVLPACAPSA